MSNYNFYYDIWMKPELYHPKHFVYIKPNDFTMVKPTVTLLCGIPTSGKSTWAGKYIAQEYIKYHGEDVRIPRILSRDDIRITLFGKKYKQNKEDEIAVSKTFNNLCDIFISKKIPIIIDNTNCKEQRIIEFIKFFKEKDYTIQIKFFDVPLWKAYYRNIKRRFQTGKWIPVRVIKDMKKSYDKINQHKYAHYKL